MVQRSVVKGGRERVARWPSARPQDEPSTTQCACPRTRVRVEVRLTTPACWRCPRSTSACWSRHSEGGKKACMGLAGLRTRRPGAAGRARGEADRQAGTPGRMWSAFTAPARSWQFTHSPQGSSRGSCPRCVRQRCHCRPCRPRCDPWSCHRRRRRCGAGSESRSNDCARGRGGGRGGRRRASGTPTREGQLTAE